MALMDRQYVSDTISRQAAIKAIMSEPADAHYPSWYADIVYNLPSAEPDMDMAEKLYHYKCYITDEDGRQHEVIYTGDIRRVTGWEI